MAIRHNEYLESDDHARRIIWPMRDRPRPLIRTASAILTLIGSIAGLR
jgi:hypothetical protein